MKHLKKLIMFNIFNFIYWFILSRYLWKFESEEKLLVHQNKQLEKYFINLQKIGKFPNITFNEFKNTPYLNKKILIEKFQEYNIASLNYEQCLEFGKKQEKTRDFSDSLKGFSIGLSSGTSGVPGVFITTKKEQIKWAAIVLGKMLPFGLILKNLIKFKKIKIVLMLRNSNNLYKALSGVLIDFQYIDLITDFDKYIDKLNQYSPTILVAPATVLLHLAHQKDKYNNLKIKPEMVISVAEVMESKEFISKVFNQPIKEIYQATEGFIGYTCVNNNLHLNESFLLIEKDCLDEEHFNPVITDFSRETQKIIRYKHDDILVVSKDKCKCGSAEKIIKQIVGRNDEIIQIENKTIFPEQIRQIFFTMENKIEDYLVEFFNDRKTIVVSFLPYGEMESAEIELKINDLIDNNSIKIITKPYDLNLIHGVKKIRIRNIK